MMLAKPRILFFNPVRHAKAAYLNLSSETRTEVVTSKSRQEFFNDLKTKYHDIVAIYRTSASGAVRSSPNSPRHDAEFIIETFHLR